MSLGAEFIRHSGHAETTPTSLARPQDRRVGRSGAEYIATIASCFACLADNHQYIVKKHDI